MDGKQKSIGSFLIRKTKPSQSEKITDVNEFFEKKCEEVFEKKREEDVEDLCTAYAEKLKVNEMQLKHAKSLLKESVKLNFEKDLKIKSLQEEVKQTTNRQELFKDFENQIQPKDMENLRSIKPGPKADSSVVLSMMRILYRPNLSILKNKSVSGKSFKGQAKEPLTPKKIKLIQAMMTERIQSENTSDTEERIAKTSRHLRAAICNINKSKYTTEPEDPKHLQKESTTITQELSCASETNIAPIVAQNACLMPGASTEIWNPSSNYGAEYYPYNSNTFNYLSL